MFDFVEPALPGGRAVNERRFAGRDESDREASSPMGRWNAPRFGARDAASGRNALPAAAASESFDNGRAQTGEPVAIERNNLRAQIADDQRRS
jgi:hypothetical protein